MGQITRVMLLLVCEMAGSEVVGMLVGLVVGMAVVVAEVVVEVVADVEADVEAEEDTVEVCVVDGDVASQENVLFSPADFQNTKRS